MKEEYFAEMSQSVKKETPQIKIVFQDKQLIVIDKPAGLPVFPRSQKDHIGQTHCVADWLAQLFPKASIIHRLDNDTSGLLVAARTDESFNSLRKIWNSDSVTKEYLALVLGITPENGKISHPIAHHPSKKKKMMVCETVEKAKKYKARRAETEFQRVRTLSPSPSPSPVKGEGTFSLLKVRIKTGVRHQIRAHLAFIGHPVVGDLLYQSKKQRALVGAVREPPLPNRHFLHLHRITLPHPMTGKLMTFKSPLPEDLKIPLDPPLTKGETLTKKIIFLMDR